MRKKNIFAALFAAVLIISAMSGTVSAEFDPESPDSVEAAAAVLADMNTGNILFEKDSGVQLAPASTTKIMTAILAIEDGRFDEVFTVGDEISEFSSASSLMGLKVGEEISMKDLIYGMMLVSGNDAANVIAVNLGGSKEGFAQMMNEKAQSIGMTNTNFVNPSGRDHDEHLVTAADMVKLTHYAMQNETFRSIVSTQSYTCGPTNKRDEEMTLENSNRLIMVNKEDNQHYYQYAIGVKTGSTNSAKNCLVAAAEKDGTTLMALVYGHPNGDGRFDLAIEMLEYGFANFRTTDLTAIFESQEPVRVQVQNASVYDPQGGYLELTPTVGSDGIVSYSGTPEEVEAIENGLLNAEQLIDASLSAPITEGQVCGRIDYKLNGEVIFTSNLIASRDVASTAEDAAVSAGPIQTLAPADVNEITRSSISPWWWLLIPGVLIVAIAARMFYVSHKRKKRYRTRRRKYPTGRPAGRNNRGYRRR